MQNTNHSNPAPEQRPYRLWALIILVASVFLSISKLVHVIFVEFSFVQFGYFVGYGALALWAFYAARKN